MAYVTGTATSHTDLWSKLIAFLTSDTALSAASQAWSNVWQASATEVMLRGPGLAGTDQVFVGLKLVADSANDSYYIETRGAAGVLPSATALDGHPNVSDAKRMMLDNGAMTYWFVANGRRFICVVKASTVYESMYGGLFLPYASSAAYPYPLFVGASAGDVLTSDFSWRSDADGHAAFPFSTIGFDTAGAVVNECSSAMMDPLGQWRRAHAHEVGSGDVDTDIAIGPNNFFSGPAAAKFSTADAPGYASLRERMLPAFGGTYALTPFTLTQMAADNQTYGMLDGCYEVSGYQQSSENTITVGASTYLVVQDTFRTSRARYLAVCLE